MKLSIIIVNYNVTELLRKCLLSIQKYAAGVPYEILVVDNCSPDDSWNVLRNEFPSVTFLETGANLGFAVANNRGAAHAKGEYLLLLNPDTELEDKGLQDILAFADAQSDFGCLGVRMHDAAGVFLPESKRSVPDIFNSFEKLFLSSKKNHVKSYYRHDINEFAVAPVDVVTGAFLLVRKDRYKEVDGLDERYFMYGEDIDLCYTLRNKGWCNWYYGKSSILHHKGESTVKDEVYLERFYGAMQIFLDKYYRGRNLLIYYVLSFGLRLRRKMESRALKQ